jgi:hypothetical protein
MPAEYLPLAPRQKAHLSVVILEGAKRPKDLVGTLGTVQILRCADSELSAPLKDDN